VTTNGNGDGEEGFIAQEVSYGKQYIARKASDGEPFFATLRMTEKGNGKR